MSDVEGITPAEVTFALTEQGEWVQPAKSVALKFENVNWDFTRALFCPLAYEVSRGV